DFTMCHPPFYSSAEDVSLSAEFKELGMQWSTNVREQQLTQVCSGAEVGMIPPDGETNFVARIFSASLQLMTKWYTSMLGKMSSIPDIVTLFREHSVHNYAITEFIQGPTRRLGRKLVISRGQLPDVWLLVDF
ncbi:uncharacterized protein EDB91DRAFT_1046231, partial [Suillus paluster]|uniref:uncharacterized protein n=1 Tax=Suillus paluster TaxID=48578 RepID=UPI001B86887A